jgi:aspartate racemase
MKASFFADVFARYGIGIVTPSPSEIEEIHNIIFPELENGIVRPEKRERFLEITRGQIASQNLDGIILGCTELPLIAGVDDFAVPVLDTAQIHIDSIVNEYFS